MAKLTLITVALSAALAPTAAAETRFSAEAGRAEPVGTHVLEGAARLLVGPETSLEDASMLVRNGRLVAIGSVLEVPADAVRHDCSGMTSRPGFVDAHVDLSRLREGEAPAPDAALAHDNARVRPERRVRDLLQLDAKKVKELRDLGFTAAAAMPSNLRDLPDEAAVAIAYVLLPEAFLAGITSSPAGVFGVATGIGRVAPGLRANLVLWDGPPLETISRVRALFLSGEELPQDDRHTRLYEKYRARPRDR